MTVKFLIKYANKKFLPAHANETALIINPTDMHSCLNKM